MFQKNQKKIREGKYSILKNILLAKMIFSNLITYSRNICGNFL
jgi:hypothetical protein